MFQGEPSWIVGDHEEMSGHNAIGETGTIINDGPVFQHMPHYAVKPMLLVEPRGPFHFATARSFHGNGSRVTMMS